MLESGVKVGVFVSFQTKLQSAELCFGSNTRVLIKGQNNNTCTAVFTDIIKQGKWSLKIFTIILCIIVTSKLISKFVTR